MDPFYFMFSGYGPTPSTGLGVLFGGGRLLLTEAPDNPGSALESALVLAVEAARRTMDVPPDGGSYYWERRPAHPGTETHEWTLGTGQIWPIPVGGEEDELLPLQHVDHDLRAAREALADELAQWVREALFGVVDFVADPILEEAPGRASLIGSLEADGWVLLRHDGMHQQYQHPMKSGLITVSTMRGAELPSGALASARRQAKLEDLL